MKVLQLLFWVFQNSAVFRTLLCIKWISLPSLQNGMRLMLVLHSLNFNERKSWSSFSMQKSLTTSEKLHSFFLFSFPDLKFFYLVYSNNVLFFIEKMGINLLHCVSCLLFTRWRANNIFSIPSHQLSICTSQSQNTFWYNSTMSVECTNPIPILVLAVLTGPFGLI